MEEIASAKIEGLIGRLSQFIDKGRMIAICDQPYEHYQENPSDFFRIGHATWNVREKSYEGEEFNTLRGYISNFLIAERYRDKGLGQTLMRFTLADIVSQGIVVASKHARFDNKKMHHILKKTGFKQKATYFADEYFYYEADQRTN